MTIQIAFLRGINVGGRATVPMAELRDLCTGLGLKDVRTLLNSGNVVFDAGSRKAAALETILEDAAEEQFGHRPDFMVRTLAELRDVIANNPFSKEAKTDPSHLLVMFFKERLDTQAVAALQYSIKGPERVHAIKRELYMVYPSGIGRSKLTNTVVEKSLGARGTGRNWNTLVKLEALGGG